MTSNTNVGRSAYTDRVKAILLACNTATVAITLAQDLQNLDRGTAHDELQWTDVQLHACRILSASGQIVFVTSDQLQSGGVLITRAKQDGYHVVVIPSSLALKLPTLQDIKGQPVQTLDIYRQEWNDSFQFTLILPDQLTPEERIIYDLTRPIMHMVSKQIMKVKEVLISETMRLNHYDTNEAVGLWEESTQRIIIKRSQLQRRDVYAATLLHSYLSALSEAEQGTLEFEEGLTEALGVLADHLLEVQVPQ